MLLTSRRPELKSDDLAPSTLPNAPSSPTGAAMLDIATGQQPITITSQDPAGPPKVISAISLLPDGKLIVLGAATGADALQLYTGTLNGLQLAVTPVGKAFRLKWPSVLITGPAGMPAYVLDKQYGVIVYSSGNTLAYDPIGALGIGATDGPVYEDDIAPGWRFGPTTVILPTK